MASSVGRASSEEGRRARAHDATSFAMIILGKLEALSSEGG